MNIQLTLMHKLSTVCVTVTMTMDIKVALCFRAKSWQILIPSFGFTSPTVFNVAYAA